MKEGLFGEGIAFDYLVAIGVGLTLVAFAALLRSPSNPKYDRTDWIIDPKTGRYHWRKDLSD
ncbi:MAG: hypothetical protein AAB955_00720 [Patescibacteria group bacterium]